MMSTSGAAKRRKKRELEQLASKLPKISTFIVGRYSSRIDALEGEIETSTSQPTHVNQPGSNDLPVLVSTVTESDSGVTVAVEHDVVEDQSDQTEVNQVTQDT